MLGRRTRPQLLVMQGLARCGGTLINRCLGAMDRVTILSEIHPDYPFMGLGPMLRQARDWFQLVGPRESRVLKRAARLNRSIAFQIGARLIVKRAEQLGRFLIIRDWSYPDFVGPPFNAQPPYKSRLVDMLSRHFTIRRIAIMRHPAEQYASTVAIAQLGAALTLETFLEGHHRFTEFCSDVPWFRYEDFSRSPRDVLIHICQALEIPYDPGWEQKWTEYEYVTGDVGVPDVSRGLRSTKIESLPFRPIDPSLLDRMRDNHHYQASLRLLGYKH